MVKVRNGVYETNSSSSHSIVVTKSAKSRNFHFHVGYATYDNGILRLSEDNHFGWGWEVLSTWLDRFAYAVAEVQYEEAMLEELLSGMKERLGCSAIIVPRRTLWGDDSKTEPDYGYIDHQSAGLLRMFLADQQIEMLDFIFDDRYIIILDNDNNDGEQHRDYIQKLDVEAVFSESCWWR